MSEEGTKEEVKTGEESAEDSQSTKEIKLEQVSDIAWTTDLAEAFYSHSHCMRCNRPMQVWKDGKMNEETRDKIGKCCKIPERTR